VRFFSIPCLLYCSALSPVVKMIIYTRKDMKTAIDNIRTPAGYDRSIVAPPSVLAEAAGKCQIAAPPTWFIVHRQPTSTMIRSGGWLGHRAVAK
jgi:hypothetical protein